MTQLIDLVEQPFDPYQHLSRMRPHLQSGSYGAEAHFIGTMRDFNEQAEVQHMTLEHYPGMTERVLKQIISEISAQQNLLATLVVHRVGFIEVGEPIVLVATWSAHRRAALQGCAELIERLKHEAPFWKQEQLTNQRKRWVEKNTPS